MRVLHLHSGNLYGGVERLLVQLARQRHVLPDMQTEIALCFEGRCATEIRETGLMPSMLTTVRWRHWRSVQRSREALRRVIADRGIDVVVTHSTWGHSIFAPVVREFKEIGLVFWAHDAIHRLTLMDRLAARTLPDRVISHSRYTSHSLAKLFGRTPIDVIYHPLILPDRETAGRADAAVRRELDCPPDAVVIVMAARFERWKGHLLLLTTLASLHNKNWIAWIAGSPQRAYERRYFRQLKRTAERLKIAGQVRFVGHRSDIPSLFAAADIHCQPNIGPEPMGVAFIEAMNAGLPIVTTDLGAAGELIAENCGVLVPPGDGVRLAAALDAMIADPAERERFDGGPARAAKLCDFRIQLPKVQAVLATTCHASRRPTGKNIPD